MNLLQVLSLVGLLAQSARALPQQAAQDSVPQGVESSTKPSLVVAVSDLGKKVEESLAELAALREEIKKDIIELAKRQSEQELALSEARRAAKAAAGALDKRAGELGILLNGITERKRTVNFLGDQFDQYIRNMDTRLTRPEAKRYSEQIQAGLMAPSNSNLTQAQIFEAQLSLVETNIGRLEETFGGSLFPGSAVNERGLLTEGNYLFVGPAGIFVSKDGSEVGTTESPLNSEPAVVPFMDPQDADRSVELVVRKTGFLVFDPTQGNARRVEATKESWIEHVEAGGPVMIPIFVLAGAALLVALYKWFRLAFIGRASRRRVDDLMDAVEAGDSAAALEHVKGIKGPIGHMLRTGVENLGEPKELIEEAMYEDVLATKYRLNSMLPFIGICASSAPLLGLLGTVTGIINTFKMITVVGSGDAKTLSGGISQALITTEYGLIVAIPSLLIHAMLSRKARGITSKMELEALTFMNQVAKDEAHSQAHSQAQTGGLPKNGSIAAQEVRAQVTPVPATRAPSAEEIERLVQTKVREALKEMLTRAEVGSGKG